MTSKQTPLKRENSDGIEEVHNKVLCTTEETGQRRANAKQGSTGGIASCNIKKEVEEDSDRAILEQIIENSNKDNESHHTVAWVTIKREQAENTPPSPPAPVARNNCSGGLSGHICKESNLKEKLDVLSKKYENSEAENQTLKIRVQNLTSELESSKLKLESDKAQINFELVCLQFASDGQIKTIKDLEQQNATQKTSLELFSKERSEVIDGLMKVADTFSVHNKKEKSLRDVKKNDQDSSVQSKRDEHRGEVVPVAQSGVLTNDDNGKSVDPKQLVKALEGPSSTQTLPGSFASVEEKLMSAYASLSYRCKINPSLKCKMELFLAMVEFYRSNVESQLRYPRNQLQKGLVVFNSCKEGFIIDSSVWHDFLQNQSTYSLKKQFRCLLIGMLDSKALFYLSLAGQTQGVNKIKLAGVHCGLKSAVYAAFKIHAKKAEYNSLHLEFERYLAALRQKICIEDLPPADASE